MFKTLTTLFILTGIVFLGIAGADYLGFFNNKIVQDTSTCVKSSGKAVKQVIEVGAFNGVIVGGPSSTLRINQDGTNSFAIEAPQNIIDLLETGVNEEGTLYISYSKCVDDSFPSINGINYYVTMDQVSNLGMGGSGKVVQGEQTITSSKLDLTLSGSGSISLDLDVVSLTSTNSGSGTIKLEGRATEHTLILSGSGKTNASDLTTEKTDATISGSGTARVNVTEELVSKVSGSGNISYEGDPKVIK